MDMVEIVARAIWDANGWHPPDAQDYQTAPWSLCKRQARAAIEAMREPTKAMTQAAHTAWFRGTPEKPNGSHSSPEIVAPYFVKTWRAQIDTALTSQS